MLVETQYKFISIAADLRKGELIINALRGLESLYSIIICKLFYYNVAALYRAF